MVMDPLVARLSSLTFSARDVQVAAGMSGCVLTNILTRTKISLCSESAGQGRARRYALIDVYQLALLHRLTRITDQAIWSTRALEHLLFSRVSFRNATATVRRRHIAHLRNEFALDISQAHPLYWTRRPGRSTETYIAIFSRADVEANVFSIYVTDADSAAGRLMGMRDGYVVNITDLLASVDTQLAGLHEMAVQHATGEE